VFFISLVTQLRKVAKKNGVTVMSPAHHNKTWETRKYFYQNLIEVGRDTQGVTV
jgi:hypothetical protein